jgi:hypothetical protein
MSDVMTAINALCAEGEKLFATQRLIDFLGLSQTSQLFAIGVSIPSRNEGVRVVRTVRSLVHGRSCAFPLEVVVVDDASTDHSCDGLPQIARESPNVSVVVRRLNR